MALPISRDTTKPARGASMIIPADTDLTYNTRAVYIGGAGIIKVDMVEGDDAVQFTVPSGALLPIQVTRIYTTTTTATLIVALY
jgi:hypothetical protein